MPGTPISIPHVSIQFYLRLFGIGVTCNDRIALIVVSSEGVLQVLGAR